MAENVRLNETIQIVVAQSRNIRGTKSDDVVTYVKLEFDGKTIGETAKVESGSDRPAEYNFTTYLDCWFQDDIGSKVTLDDVASKPLLLTFVEVLPKEKKQREEKAALLGQCTIDLMPLLEASQTQINRTYPIWPISPPDAKPGNSNLFYTLTAAFILQLRNGRHSF